MKKLRSLLMNLVFFIESSSLCGVKRLPSKISLMITLCATLIKISLPVPLFEVLLLKHVGLFDLQIEPLIIDL